MLDSNPYEQFWFRFNFYSPNPINELVKRVVRELAYLFLPEDTTDKGGDSHYTCINLLANSARRVVKAVFWIAAAIIISLAVGQFK